MNKWYKFLVENSEKTFSIATDEVRFSEFQLFEKTWKTKPTFRRKIIADVMRLDILPAFSRLPRNMQTHFYQKIMEYATKDENTKRGMAQLPPFVNYMVEMGSESDCMRVIYGYGENELFCELMYALFKKNEGQVFDNFLETIKDSHIGVWARIYHFLYDKFPEETPKIPIINKMPESTNYVLNMEILKRKFKQFSPSDDKKDLLKDIRIGKEIGSGFYGTVYQIVNQNRVIKFFTNSVSLKHDIDRIKNVQDQMFAGSASMKDMHYFDYGTLGTSRDYSGDTYEVYYAIMPKIIPLYRNSPVLSQETLSDLCASNKFAALRFVRNNNPKPSEDEFYSAVEDIFDSRSDYITFASVLSDYGDEVEKIVDAGYRAFITYGGTDLHANNIGYIAGVPDYYFYFDM